MGLTPSLSKEAQHATLGTDIYDKDKKHVGRSPFEPNAAMVFVPTNITFHGFEARRAERGQTPRVDCRAESRRSEARGLTPSSSLAALSAIFSLAEPPPPT